MSCDKPSGDCTTPANCSDCGCADQTATPILPKCQDVALTPGTYTHATIVVNDIGCISAISSGVPEPYTPDDCCGKTVGQTLASSIAEVMAAITPTTVATPQPTSYSALEAEVVTLNNIVVELQQRVAALEAK